MSRFVRSSKYRHVFGTAAKADDSYAQIKVTRSAWDTNKLAASTKFWACIWEAGGGGAFVVSTFDDTGKRTPNPPLVSGHKGAVLDLDFHPFNPSIVGSTSEDCTVKIWAIPEGGLKEHMTESAQTLIGHRRKVGTIRFNPVANNICVTSATDYTVKVWDVEKGTAVIDLEGHTQIIQSTEWNYNGSLLVTSSKDKNMRIFDVRAGADAEVAKTHAHDGVKGFRSLFLGNTDLIATVGFSRTSDRQYAIWDQSTFDKPVAKSNIDTSSGQLMPFYDNDTKMLFLAGKGDGNIRYYELDPSEEKKIFPLSEYKSSSPQKGLCTLPKRALNVPKCEVVRFLKVTPKNVVEPVSFRVPRKSDLFQDDIFPDAYAGIAALDADAWLGGENADPVLKSMEPSDMPAAEAEPVAEIAFEKKEEVVLDEKALRDAYATHTKRIAFLEAEMKKKDARIAELEAAASGGD